jgi:hypothetical protein
MSLGLSPIPVLLKDVGDPPGSKSPLGSGTTGAMSLGLSPIPVILQDLIDPPGSQSPVGSWTTGRCRLLQCRSCGFAMSGSRRSRKR